MLSRSIQCDFLCRPRGEGDGMLKDLVAGRTEAFAVFERSNCEITNECAPHSFNPTKSADKCNSLKRFYRIHEHAARCIKTGCFDEFSGRHISFAPKYPREIPRAHA